VTVTVPEWQELAGIAFAVSERKQVAAENNNLTFLALGIKGLKPTKESPEEGNVASGRL
jgi:hypothetical protein